MSAVAPGGARHRPRLAAASSSRFPDLHDDWPLLRAGLADAGVDAMTAVWNDPDVDWAGFDLVLASGAWDNIHHVDEFLAWADGVAAAGVPVLNPPATLRWNIDKRYLRDLERAGVPTVPTLWVEPDVGSLDPSSLVLPVGELVVKPSVSGGGYRTARYGAEELHAARAHVGALVGSGRTAMVQPYEHGIDARGETDLVFIGGAFSHAVHKDPMIRRGVGPGDSLMENLVVTAATATAGQLAVAGDALAAAQDLLGPSAYARVDLVDRMEGGPALLELELLDPVLFFVHHPEGAATFARLLAGQLAAA